MTQVAEKLQPWLGALEERPKGGPRWLQDLRERAAARFAALGFPTVREEEWRFTPVTPIASSEFHLAGAGPALTEADLTGYVYGDAPARLVIVNGRFSPELSRTAGLPAGVRVGSLAAALSERADDVARFLGRLADFESRPFAALNTAFVDDGAVVQIPDKTVVEAPIQLLFVTTSRSAGAADAVMAHPRVLIIAGDGSQSRIVETYVGPRGEKYFANAVTEVFVGENAHVDHYKVQEDSVDAFHVASMHVHLARSSTFSSHSFTLGGKLVRNDVLATLDGEGAECTLNGLYLADGDRLVDNHTTIDHARAHCPSHEVYKGILGGRARAVFNGKIIVRQDAQKTDAKQTNRALLLTDDAAIGQLDEDAIFYLRARGLTFFEARDMLIHAFAGDILDRVQVDALRTALEAELYAQLAKDLAEMDGV